MTESNYSNGANTIPIEDETKAESGSADSKISDPSQQVFKNLIILPPLQKSDKKDEGDSTAGATEQEIYDSVPLPPIRAEEPVSSIRAALGEVRGYAHITNYRFVLENKRPGNHENKICHQQAKKSLSSSSESESIASIYTGLNAAITTKEVVKSFLDGVEPTNSTTKSPVLAKDSVVLDEFGDLTSLLADDDCKEEGLKDGSRFRIVLERYDIASIRDHITRLRTLLDGNAPTSTSLDDNGGEMENSESTSQSANSNVNESKSSDDTGGNSSNAKANPTGKSAAVRKEEQDKPVATKQKKDGQKLPPTDMPVFSSEKKLSPDVNDLKKFFYYACGEDPLLYLEDADSIKKETVSGSKSKKKGKKKNSKASLTNGGNKTNTETETKQQMMKRVIPQLNEIEERTRVCCDIRFSGFHPPPKYRQLMGDLAYLEVTLPDGELVSISATPIGFYINRSSLARGDYKFDPSPAEKPCFSHELMDCLLIYSKSFLQAWGDALIAAKTRADLLLKINEHGPFQSFFRVAIRGDFPGYKKPSVASASEGIDALVQIPSWLVPIPKVELEDENSWNRNTEHAYSSAKIEGDLSNSFGVDIRNGSLRDWNEELQVAREMPMDNLLERVERARVLNKVLTDFGEAVLLGVKAISEGQVTPMNPNEPLRSQVFLHNNIFFSRAVDAGLETFKVAKGDRAARKSASRDLHCLGALHRMERTGLHTLATAVIDYLGSRFVCQSILPGILSGEKTHTLLYGAVETGVPLVWDEEMHNLFETTLGKGLMIATRPMLKQPLTPERLAEIEDAKNNSLFIEQRKSDDEEKTDHDNGQTIELCAPLEAKGIRGSDQRKYVLDMTRLTPRDANWIPKEKGGTGNWESVKESSSSEWIPESLDDEEWTLAVLRSELVSLYAQMKMAKYVQEKRSSADGEKDASIEEDKVVPTEDDKKNSTNDDIDKKKNDEKKPQNTPSQKKKMSEDDLAYLNSLRFNVNVFLPDIQSLKDIDDTASEQIKTDEDLVRDAAIHLWNMILPGVTNEIRMGTVHTVPHEGKSLTEFIHQRGINCRYLGRLAKLAQVEEERDKKQWKEFKENKPKLERRKMPAFWLELLECEMVARASKHVLDRYLNANIYANIGSLSQIVASFLCALVSESEETAADTENRTNKLSGPPDEDDLGILTLFQTGGTIYPLKSRHDVWIEIEEEIGRRFRYSLTIFNQTNPSDRAAYMPLLRRVCQRNGIRLVAKFYDIGSKCMCSGPGTEGSIISSYPISALDIVDIVPLMKHAAAHSEGFVACGSVPTTGLPALHISLPDARATLEQAHLHHNKRLLSRALDLAQEAAGLYQRVSETPAHPGVVRCIDLIASILYDAGEPALAAQNAARALGYQTQISGFDSPDIINLHFVMFQFLLAADQTSQAVKHMKAAIYLMELVGGKNHSELPNAYHKAGTVYHGVSDLKTALRFYQAANNRDPCDRLLEAMVSKSSALVLAGVGDFKEAVENEKRAFQLFSVLLGNTHTLTKQSDQALHNFMRAAVEHGSRMVDDLKKKREEEAAEAIAIEIEAEEAAEELRRKKKSQKKKKGKRN